MVRRLMIRTTTAYIGYEGPRVVGETVNAHLAEYRFNLAQAAAFEPVIINVQSGR